MTPYERLFGDARGDRTLFGSRPASKPLAYRRWRAEQRPAATEYDAGRGPIEAENWWARGWIEPGVTCLLESLLVAAQASALNTGPSSPLPKWRAPIGTAADRQTAGCCPVSGQRHR
jgi:hypothetical protein